MLVNQEGVYRGVILDGGLSESSGGFPQEVLSLKAEEVYDTESDSWLPADAENAEITYYGVLIDSKDHETKNCKQLKKIIGWDGASFLTLSEMNMAGIPIQFRVEEKTYQENTSLQVTWIDTPDAPPFRTVQKLDKESVKALQQKYASVLASTKSAVKPVAAPVSAPKTAPKTTPPTTVAEVIENQKPTPRKKPSLPAKTVVGKCTADEAYMACYSLKKDDVTDEALSDLWLKVVASVNEDESKITKEGWFTIKETILKQVGKV